MKSRSYTLLVSEREHSLNKLVLVCMNLAEMDPMTSYESTLQLYNKH